MRRIFNDERYERLFERDGCVLIEALDAAAVKRIEEFYLANCDQDFTGFRNSLELPSPEQKAKIDKFLAQIFDEFLSRYFNDYRSITNTFHSKMSDPASLVRPHQDWSLVNEAEYTSLNLWIPLCDTNADNGALGVFKGSHRLKRTLRGTLLYPNLSLSDHHLKYLTFFHMKAGEVLVLSPRTIHASGPNRSGEQRTAVNINIIPSEARPVHYVGGELRSSKVLELEVDAEFYYNYHLDRKHWAPSDDHVVNTGGYSGKEIDYAPVRIDGHDIMRLYEPRVVTALRNIKDRLKAKLSFR